MNPSTAGDAPHDSELTALLARVVDLSAAQYASGPDTFLHQLEQLAAELEQLRLTRGEADLTHQFEAFAVRRFALVDEGSEYAAAADEILVLASVVATHPQLATLALKHAVKCLSEVLGEEGVPRQFKRLLQRLRQGARRAGDDETRAWVEGVIASLPGDENV